MVDAIPKITLFKEPPGRTRTLTPQEFERLHRELPEHLAEMALFSMATGLRQGEMKNLQWQNVNMEIAQAWIDASQHKNGHAKGVPLGDVAMDVCAGSGERIQRMYSPTKASQ